MIQPITLVTAGIFFGVLFLRYRSRPKDRPQRTRQQQLKSVKLLFAALLVWLAVSYSLRHTLAKMNGADYEPTFMERAVAFLSK